VAVSSSIATVFHGGGRRWLSRRSAERAEAKAIVRRRCECDRGDTVTPGYACVYHSMEPQKFDRMIHLLVVMFIRKGQ
jgi:hypothetical protein